MADKSQVSTSATVKVGQPSQKGDLAGGVGPRAEVDVAALSGVTKTFGTRTVLDGIDLRVRKGEFVALLGASGSGKTTLLRILSSLDMASSGTLLVTQNRSVVFQEPRLMPFMRVEANVTFGLSRQQRRQVDAIAALDEVGLADHKKDWPKSLSGGEAQRVALARALVRAPDLLLLDEPFAALDALTRIRMQNLVLELWQRHSPGVVFVTHDVEEAIALADRVLVLKDGSFSKDLRLTTSRPRDKAADAFMRIRQELLSELGVGDDLAPGCRPE
jgi:sulfonate transport system ATP-binding protein